MSATATTTTAKPLSASLAALHRGYAAGLALVERAKFHEYQKRVAAGLEAAEDKLARTGFRPQVKPSRKWREAKPGVHTLGFLAALMGAES